jgi:ABC-type multidrug transport system fused ATPase/permease subunit
MYRIQKELNSTIIIVSHGLSAVQGADKIIVLKNGEVKEIGTHQDLVINNGWYAKTWKIQSNL